MSQAGHRDIEQAHGDHPQSTQNQPLRGESNFGDSSGPLFSIYSKAADDEDNKMAERWKNDADGILIFTGLFSAAVAALLSVTVQDLRPNSQDTSAFYLGNIYGVLADPNSTRSSIPSPVAKPPPFSPPRYAIWVNSLWFLSLVISLTCALLATSMQQWIRRYIRITQRSLYSPEKRARMRAYFAEGLDEMHIHWAVEGLPTLLHLSVFLFFGGLAVFLFNLDHAVFGSVIWWIGLFLIVYGLITVMPIFRHDSPYYAPLSRLTWFLYAGMNYVFFKIRASTSGRSGTLVSWLHFSFWKDRYHGWMLGGVEKAAEEKVSERSSDIDIRIFDWTIGILGEGDLEPFFEAVPGFFSSKLVKHLEKDFPEESLGRFWSALNGFMSRTLSSNSVIELVKTRRVNICRDIMSIVPCPFSSRYDTLSDFFDQAPVSVEKLKAMARWSTHEDHYVAACAQVRVAKTLASMQELDDDWFAFASEVSGLAPRDLRDNSAQAGDNVLLATLNDVSRRAIHFQDWRVVGALTQLDIIHTLPGLQHDFCTLWNELVQEAKIRGPHTTPIHILRWIRHLYIALHQGTDAAPTAFSAFTPSFDRILSQPSSYPLCDIADHRAVSATQVPVVISGTVPLPTQPGDSSDAPPHSPFGVSSTLQVAEGTNTVAGLPSSSPPDQPDTIASEIEETSQTPTATFLALPNSTFSDRSPQRGVATAQPDTTSAATLSQPLESNRQEDLATPSEAPLADIGEISPIMSTPEPVRASTPRFLNKSFATYDTVPAFISKSSPPASFSGFSVPDSPSTPHVPTLPNTQSLSLIRGMSPKSLSDNARLPTLRTRGLIDKGDMYLANAVLQSLVCCPPFRDLFKDLRRVLGQREGGKTAGGATPLIDATNRFLGEFAYKPSSPTTQFRQQAASGRAEEDEDGNKEDEGVQTFPSTYVYDAMTEKNQFIINKGGQLQDAAAVLGLYLEALDEELVTLTHESALALGVGELEEKAQPAEGQTEVGEQDYAANLAESPISRIFGGRSRSTVRAPNQPDTVTVEDWRSLQLNIQPGSVHTIQDSLVHSLQPQPLQVGQSSAIKASQQVRIEALPPVLILHLKRFLYDTATDGIVKITKPIQFEPVLEIPPEIMAPVAGKSAEPAHYKLYGVLCHHGESAVSGHYTVDVLHPNGGGGNGEAWLRIDNEAVSTVNHEDVFGGEGHEWGDRSAYVLFYCRTLPHGHG